MVTGSDLPAWAVAIVVAGYLVSAIGAALHALLTKQDPRSALSWMALCVLVPYGGPLLYWLLGINRVHRVGRDARAATVPGPPSAPLERIAESWRSHIHLVDALTRRPLAAGNLIEVLHNGEQAFPRMLESIGAARRSVYLATYIFETDSVGRQFVDALGAAASRGVEVRVLVDGIGEWYSWPHVVPLLRRAGVNAQRFLPPRFIPPNLSLNCRNHRKILVVDDRTAFIGGMNLGGREIGGGTGRRMSDVHFSLRGPVVAQLSSVFAEDWSFAAHEQLPAPSVPSPVGESVCRVITGGPDQDLDKLPLVLIGAIAAARHDIQIMTPYFIPPLELVVALETAALRGVRVTIVLPRHSNLRYIDWATLHWLPSLVARGVRVHLQEPPFSHAKLFIIDDAYAHIGSVNIDTRSLRLNFENAVEVYDRTLCRTLGALVEARAATAAALTPESAPGRSLAERIRNAVCWLISPYL